MRSQWARTFAPSRRSTKKASAQNCTFWDAWNWLYFWSFGGLKTNKWVRNSFHVFFARINLTFGSFRLTSCWRSCLCVANTHGSVICPVVNQKRNVPTDPRNLLVQQQIREHSSLAPFGNEAAQALVTLKRNHVPSREAASIAGYSASSVIYEVQWSHTPDQETRGQGPLRKVRQVWLKSPWLRRQDFNFHLKWLDTPSHWMANWYISVSMQWRDTRVCKTHESRPIIPPVLCLGRTGTHVTVCTGDPGVMGKSNCSTFECPLTLSLGPPTPNLDADEDLIVSANRWSEQLCAVTATLEGPNEICVSLGDLRWVARFGLMSQIGASQIEAPIGSVFQKYVYIQHFHGQDEDWLRIFRTLLVHFMLGIMREERICQIWIFGFLRSKKSNLEVQKKWGVDV